MDRSLPRLIEGTVRKKTKVRYGTFQKLNWSMERWYGMAKGSSYVVRKFWTYRTTILASRLRIEAKAKNLSFENKAKDLSFEAKNKNFKNCPRGHGRP